MSLLEHSVLQRGTALPEGILRMRENRAWESGRSQEQKPSAYRRGQRITNGTKPGRKKGWGLRAPIKERVLERGAGRKQGWIGVLVYSWRKGNFSEFSSIVLFLVENKTTFAVQRNEKEA